MSTRHASLQLQILLGALSDTSAMPVGLRVTYYYRYVLIQSYHAHGEPSKHSVRARPLPGQGLPTTMRVECSSRMRESHPVGTIFKVWAKIKDTQRDPHLYTSWQWPYDVLERTAARAFIATKDWGTKPAEART